MKEAEDMITHEDEVDANGPHYASLTAGLLARKGEAVPAAAAFTAEAIAQHIPARRLAQEAERVITDRHEHPPRIVTDSAETIGNDDQASDIACDSAPVISRQHKRIEEAFVEDSALRVPAERESARPRLDMRSDLGVPERNPLAALTKAPPQAPLPGLEESDENWFEDIVSKAISEAEGHGNLERSQAGIDRLVANEASDKVLAAPASLADASGTQSIVNDAKIPGRGEAGCGSKAQKVRRAIRSGNTQAAVKSAMRLDPRRFIRLSLAGQKLGLTNQEIMTAALDTYLDALDDEVFSDCSCMKKGLI